MRQVYLFTALILGTLALVGCRTTTAPSLHEVQLFGAQDLRLTYAYGAPTTLMIGGREVSLAEGRSEDPLGVLTAALVDGEPYLREDLEGIEAPAQVKRIPLTTDLLVSVAGPVDEVVYYDGDSWLTLVEQPPVGLSARVIPVPRIGRMRGIGQLTREEADAIASGLEARDRPFALYVLPEDSLVRRAVDGLEEHLLTGLYVDEELVVDPEAFEPAPRTVQWEVLAAGAGAVGIAETSYFLTLDRVDLIGLWTRGHSSESFAPPVPEVDFDREAVVAIFLGERPTSGYGIQIERVDIEGNDLFIDFLEITPGEENVETTAVTSPWLMIRVLRGGINVAWFRDPRTEALVGVARALR